MTILIAGSGPAGVFAALGALEAGAKVLMVDPGLSLEPDVQAFKENLANRHWKHWTPEEYATLGMSPVSAIAGLSQKRVLGSDFATRQTAPGSIEEIGCKLTRSSARGGLSNIWGRGIEPPYGSECDHWSFKEDLIASMRTVLSHIPFCGGPDNLAEVMPLYSQHCTPQTIRKASDELLEKWHAHETALNRRGIHFGRTRLAMRQDACRQCGMCFYGCPYEALYNAGEMIPYLAAHYPGFEYRPGLCVKKFASCADGSIDVMVETIAEKKESGIKAGKLILAAGAAQTTIIVMQSLAIQKAILKNSDLIKIPFLKLRRPLGEDEEYHSLSQLTLTVDRRSITRKAIVIHLFGKNPMVRDAILSMFPSSWRAGIKKLLSPLLCRLFIGMCFLHSDDSSTIEVKDDEKNTVFSGRRKFAVFIVYIKLLAFLALHIRKTGLLPLPFPGSMGIPGSSAHYGSSIPINGKQVLSTDSSGRLTACTSVYIADAASLPDIQAGSYTLSIMANAHRIGKTAGALE